MNAIGKMNSSFSDAWNRLNAAPKSDFMVSPEMTMSKGDLAGLVQHLAAEFEAKGVSQGDRVFIRTKDEGCAIISFLTCLLDGVVPVMVSPGTPNERATHIAEFTDAKLVVLDAAEADGSGLDHLPAITVTDAAPARKKLRLKGPSAQEVISARFGLGDAHRHPRLPSAPGDLAYLLFTSGTTSDPAGVMISYEAMTTNLATIASILEIDENSRIFNDMILAHADGMIQGPVMALLTGGVVIRAGGFAVDRIEEWLNRAHKMRATHFMTVPTVWTMIDRYCTHDDYFDAPEFKYLVTVAAAMPQPLWERLEERFKRPLVNQYGLTETVASALYAGDAPRAGARFTVGLPVDCEARIDFIEGHDQGELLLRGSNIFDGYWKNPDRTASTLTSDGWLRTGDMASMRDDGSYEIVGRLKTVIMSAGFLIRPEEIDDTLSKHPQIHEVITVGLPNADFGEIAVTAVVCDADGPSEAELKAYAQSKLEALKVPKRIIAMDSIPRGDAGKPKLDAVRSLLSDALQTSRSDKAADAGDVDGKLIELAASVFYVSPDELSLSSKPDTVAGWDSFTHIALILALEEGFGVRIPPHRAAALRSLGDAAIAVREAQA